MSISRSCAASTLDCLRPIRTGSGVSASTSPRLTHPLRWFRACLSWTVCDDGTPRGVLSLLLTFPPEAGRTRPHRLASPSRAFRICISMSAAASQRVLRTGVVSVELIGCLEGKWAHLELRWETLNLTTVANQAKQRAAESIFVTTNHLGRGILYRSLAGLGLVFVIMRPDKMVPLLRYRFQRPPEATLQPFGPCWAQNPRDQNGRG